MSEPNENIIPLALKICRRLLGPRLWGCTLDGGWTRPIVVVHEGQYYYKNSEKVTDEPMSTEAHLSNRFEDDLKAGIYVASGDYETEEDIKMQDDAMAHAFSKLMEGLKKENDGKETL